MRSVLLADRAFVTGTCSQISRAASFAPAGVTPIATIVVPLESPTLSIVVVQERVALPSICKVRAPPSAMPQPNFVPVMPSPLRNTQSSGVSPSTSTLPVRDEPAQLMQENQGRFSCSHSPRRGWLHRLY